MSGSLEGRTALVTGGSRGIGRGISESLAAAGVNVLFTYVSNDEAAQEVVKAIEAKGGKVVARQCDVADLEQVEQAVAAAIEAFGGLDIVVNNAGVTSDQLILRMKPEQFDRVIATNLRGTWNVCRAASKPMLRKRKGRIINMSSLVAAMGNQGQSNYAATKGGIESLTRSLSRELAGRGITVNAISPGFIETGMTEELPDMIKLNMLNQIPLGRFGSVEEVAYAVRFLASDEASYITGQVIHVNGGML